MSHLIDTNVLLRLQKSDNAQGLLAIQATERLRQQGEQLSVARQNLIEFRNTASRPLDKNGLGLTPADADLELNLLERDFNTLPENDQVYDVWRQLIAAKGFRGNRFTMHGWLLLCWFTASRIS